jgi:hypothetical protein
MIEMSRCVVKKIKIKDKGNGACLDRIHFKSLERFENCRHIQDGRQI